MAITFFGAATTPADNSGSSLGPTVTLTPPASMVDGDLVYVSVRYRDSAATIATTPSNTGGQTWNAPAQYNATNIRARVFWCRYNGTWSANPAFTVTSGGNNIDAQMLVFRPTSVTRTWTLEAGPTASTYTAPSTPFTVTITGRTTTAASTVTIGAWHSVDDNTWGSLSGTGWSKTSLTAQYRNNDTADNSSSFAYYIATSASTVIPDVSQNQAALGGDAGSWSLTTFAETVVTALPTTVVATASAGSLAISDPTVGLLGHERAASAGTITVPSVGPSNATATAVGASSTASAGTPGVLISSVVAVVGAGVAASAGTTIESTSAVPVGVSATAQAGTAVGIAAASGVVPIPGVPATAQAGSLGLAITVAGVAGVQSAAQAGTITASGAGIVHATGQTPGILMTASAGTVTVPIQEPIAGVQAIVTAESLGASAVISEIDGVTATASAGSLLTPVSTTLPWVEATALAGTIAPRASSVTAPLGVAAIGAVGTVAGVTAGFTVGVPPGVFAVAAAGTLMPSWTFSLEIPGTFTVAEAGDPTVQGGVTSSDETFPAGVQATAQAGELSTGEVRASPFGIQSLAEAGILVALARTGGQPLFGRVSVVPANGYDAIAFVPVLQGTLFVEPLE